MDLRVVGAVREIPANQWNALCDADNPFIRHEFLAALETTGCVGGDTGWLPQHLALYDGGRLIGAMPLYVKSHSFGEFVFDWAWANAYRRAQLAYYPKLVAAVPYSPVTGPRLLIDPSVAPVALDRLLDGCHELARQYAASSIHWLFTDRDQTALLAQRGYLLRTGMQFHWYNAAGYADFAALLADFSSKKRKNVLRERRQVAEAGITVDVAEGGAVDAAQWRRFFELFSQTNLRKGGMVYLNAAFFQMLGATLPEHVLLVRAHHRGEMIAGALCLRGSDALFGRNYGCVETFSGLHFEVCYYTPLEYCLAHGIGRFEAGAQGEHKLSRGFLPTPTYSAHWIADERFRAAIARYVVEEAAGTEHYMQTLQAHSPFKSTEPPS